jgi:hypothetical protein
MNNRLNREFDQHVIFCTPNDRDVIQTGRAAEWGTAEFIVDNLSRAQAGDYRILMNYNLRLRNPGAYGAQEIDLVMINRRGIFLLEVKDWRGTIQAYDDEWLVSGRKRPNPLGSVQQKARIFHSTFFGSRSDLAGMGRVSVVGLVVLYRSRQQFTNLGSPETGKGVLDLPGLVQALNSAQFLHHGRNSQELADNDIRRVTTAVHEKYTARREEIIGNYRILGELSPGDLFDAYEAQNIDLPAQRVRLKRYQLPSLIYRVDEHIRQFQRSAGTLAELGPHPNIVSTLYFFSDTNRPDIFYEVTELVDGERLDEIMSQRHEPVPLEEQLACLKPVCEALIHAHNHRRDDQSSPIYHRNICPETIFITNRGTIKLADFDFAKVSGNETITIPGQTLIDKTYTAPELLINPSSASPASDIYSLGVLWYSLAKLPEQLVNVDHEQIDQLPLPEGARDLMKSMLATAPANRPSSVEQVLQKLQELK